MVKHFCDRCGKQIGVVNEVHVIVCGEQTRYELCCECRAEFSITVAMYIAKKLKKAVVEK